MVDHDADKQLLRRVKELHRQKPKPRLEERFQQVEQLIEEYIATTGTRPSAEASRIMSDYLLLDLLTDKQKHWRGEEYPFHSNRQSRRRRNRQVFASEWEELQ